MKKLLTRADMIAILLMLGLATVGCRSIGVVDPPHQSGGPWWDVDRAEFMVWDADDPAFRQGMALEASGLVAHEGRLLIVSEKYARLIDIDSVTMEAVVSSIGLPRYAEVEGVTVDGREVLMCDEANAAIWMAGLPDDQEHETLVVERMDVVGIELPKGKLGVEGITVSDTHPREVFVALERHGGDEEGCMATIFTLRRAGHQELVSSTDPLAIPMEDCNWRLTGLQYWNGHLLALKTRYPGERYEVVVIDRETGGLTTVLEMTDLLIGVRKEGWGNNIEGLSVADDGALWLVSDNAMTKRAESSTPPPARDKTLLMRLPPLHLPRIH